MCTSYGYNCNVYSPVHMWSCVLGLGMHCVQPSCPAPPLPVLSAWPRPHKRAQGGFWHPNLSVGCWAGHTDAVTGFWLAGCADAILEMLVLSPYLTTAYVCQHRVPQCSSSWHSCKQRPLFDFNFLRRRIIFCVHIKSCTQYTGLSEQYTPDWCPQSQLSKVSFYLQHALIREMQQLALMGRNVYGAIMFKTLLL